MRAICWACCGMLATWAVMARDNQLNHQQADRITPATFAKPQGNVYQPPAQPDFFPGP